MELLGAGYQTGAVNGQHLYVWLHVNVVVSCRLSDWSGKCAAPQHRYVWLHVNGVVRLRLSDWSGKWAAPVFLPAGEWSC